MAQSWGSVEQAEEAMQDQKKTSEKLTKFDMLDETKLSAFVRVLGQLQLEGIQIEKSKNTFESILRKGEQQLSEAASKEAIESKKGQIEGALSYLLKNTEALEEEMSELKVDPIHKL